MKSTFLLGIFVCFSLAGCGTFTPMKDPLQPFEIDKAGYSIDGITEANIVSNIRCEVQNGLYKSYLLGSEPWLPEWGTQVTLKLTWDDFSGLTPGITSKEPFSATTSFALGFGGTLSAHATRVETITFIWENRKLIADAKTNHKGNSVEDCTSLQDGIMVKGDLKIDQFLYDKASIAKSQIATTEPLSHPQFTTLQDELTFVGILGGSVTPTWTLTRIAANTTGTLASATRTTTGDVLITLGALAKDKHGKLLPQLAEPAASQHTGALIGGNVATQNTTQGK